MQVKQSGWLVSKFWEEGIKVKYYAEGCMKLNKNIISGGKVGHNKS